VRSLCAGSRSPGKPGAVLVPALGVPEDLGALARECARWTVSSLLDVFARDRRVGADLPAVTAVTAAWLRAVPTGPVVLVGHSTGAQAALQAAVRAPAAVRALVLLSPTFAPELRRTPALLRAYFRDSAHEPLDLWRTTLPGCARVGATTLLRLVRSARHDRPEDAVADVRCPVLVVRGERDALCPAHWAEGLGAAARQGRCATVPGGHGFPHVHSRHTADLIARFTEECR